MAFHLGSLGFLTPFQFNNFQDQVTNVLEGHAALTLRSRLKCSIVRKSNIDHKSDSNHNDTNNDFDGNGSISSNNDLPPPNILVLNEVIKNINRRLPSWLINSLKQILGGHWSWSFSIFKQYWFVFGWKTHNIGARRWIDYFITEW